MDVVERVTPGETALCAAEWKRLNDLEDVVARGIAVFTEVGAALLEIRDGRLYRATHAAFEAYCRDRWQMSKTNANRLVAAAEVVGNLTPMGVILPTNERQARELAALPAPEQQEVWREVIETATEHGITAARVREVLQQQIRIQTPPPALPKPLRAPAGPLHPSVQILQGDAIAILRTLPAESVHMVCTSPPYWGLRAYLPDDHPLKAQELGLEPTPEEHVRNLVAVFREVRRVLRRDGTVWLNYADMHATAPNGRSAADTKAAGNDDRTFRDKPFSTVSGGLKPKDLVMMPHRVAMALQADGWWVRSEIVWAKANPLPESVRDRPSRSHEYLFLLARSAAYYYDADAIREPVSPDSLRDTKNGARGREKANAAGQRHTGPSMRSHWEKIETDPAGRNKRTVWEIPTQSSGFDHYASFPEALVRPCVLAGTSAAGVCSACGAPWKREVADTPEYETRKEQGFWRGGGSEGSMSLTRGAGGNKAGAPRVARQQQTIGWTPTCQCNGENTTHAVVLDPFGGSGTVGKVATDLGRHAILIELSEEYCAMARERNAQKKLL